MQEGKRIFNKQDMADEKVLRCALLAACRAGNVLACSALEQLSQMINDLHHPVLTWQLALVMQYRLLPFLIAVIGGAVVHGRFPVSVGEANFPDILSLAGQLRAGHWRAREHFPA